MKQSDVIKYLSNKIKYYERKYKESGEHEYLCSASNLKNAIITLKETK